METHVVLITTYGFANSGCGVYSLTVEFATQELAEAAVEKVNKGAPRGGTYLSQSAVYLGRTK